MINYSIMEMLKKFLPRFRRSRGVSEALKIFIRPKELQELVAKCPDRRELIGFAAERLGKTEEELVQLLSEASGIPVMSRISPIDTDLHSDNPSLDDFYRTGSIGIFHQGLFTGVVCIDPSVASGLLPTAISQNIYLGSWEKIRAALEESKTLLGERREQERRAAEQIELTKITDAFELLLNKVKEHGAQSVRILFEKEEPVYRFETSTGQEAWGTIHPSIREGFLRYIQTLPEKSEKFTVNTIQPELLYEFHLTLPKKPPLTLIEDVPKPDTFPPDQPPTVLIIDDNQVFRTVLEQYLTSSDMQTRHAKNGREALELLNEETPDLIVCDAHMPNISGLEFLTYLRRDRRFHQIPVIMLTSDESIEIELQALNSGADAFLQKSEDPRKLCAYIERLLRQYKVMEAA